MWLVRKKRRGGVVAVVVVVAAAAAAVVVVVFCSLIAERSGRRRNASCPAEASTPECNEGSSPVEHSESLAPWGFPSQATHVSYIAGTWYGVHRMDVLVRVFCFFLQNEVAIGKRKSKTRKEQRTAQAASTTTNTGRRAHRPPHFVAARIPAVCISESSVGCGLLTALWLAKPIYVKNVNLHETTTPARKNCRKKSNL